MRAAALLVLAVVASAVPAVAQQPQARVHISADGLYQPLFDPFSKVSSFQLFFERGQFTAEYPPNKAPAFAGTAAVRLWRSIGAGVTVTRMQSTTDAAVQGEIPHPFFFDRNRRVAGTVDGIAREELGIHAQFRLIVPVTPRFDLAVFAGPSMWQIRQDRIVTITYSSQYPFDEAAFGGATVQEASGTAWGYNAGIDFGLYFSKHVGAGALLLLATANPDTVSTASAADTRIGGMRVGGGLRLRF